MAQSVIVSGEARLDRRTKDLTRRLEPGNIAIVDHAGIDRVAAESLIENGVAAVVNVSASVSGNYPNLGPLLLVKAGIPLLDEVGPDVFGEVKEGESLRLEGQQLIGRKGVVATGTILDEVSIKRRMDSARAVLSETVEEFAENTLDYIRSEQDLLLEAVRLPEISTGFSGRHALVVTRGYHYKEDLHALRGYIWDCKPVVVAVDGAADACIAQGIRPDVIVGDVDSISSEGLQCGAEILVHPQGSWRREHAGGDGAPEPPEAKTVRQLGLNCKIITAPGTSEDVAMLLAHEKGAELIVTVGSRTSMVEFLDKGRPGMASTFLVRMRLGATLVDAKGVSQLYRTRVSTRDFVLLMGAALFAMAVVSIVMPPMRLFWVGVWDQITQLVGKVF